VTPMTPIQAWPPRVFGGKPGYSRKHFASLVGGPEDPLRVAERFAGRRDAEAVAAEAKRRLGAGESFESVGEWQFAELTRMAVLRWERLCGSFDAVIETLETAPQSNAVRALVREAKRAKEAR
jgi:hypothetical protein